jgi:hypothetical protein
MAKVSTNYQPLVNQGQPVILKIVVVESTPNTRGNNFSTETQKD